MKKTVQLIVIIHDQKVYFTGFLTGGNRVEERVIPRETDADAC